MQLTTQRKLTWVLASAFVSLLIVSMLSGPNTAASDDVPQVVTPQDVKTSFDAITKHVEPKPSPPANVVATPVAVHVPHVSRPAGYGPLKGGGWWRAGPLRRLLSAPFRLRCRR